MRTKFKCHAVHEFTHDNHIQDPDTKQWKPSGVLIKSREEVEFYPVTGGSPENQSFATATPAGHVRLTIDNPKAWGHFQIGVEYFIDFSAAPVPAAS